MNWIKLSINNGEVNGVFELDKLSNEHKLSMIDGFFRVFGAAESKQNAPHVKTSVLTEPTKFEFSKDEIVIPLSKVPLSKDFISKMKSGGIIENPQLLNSKRNLSIPVGEKLAAAVEAAKEQPEWWTTGIKYKEDGVPHYRCRYYCKNPGCQAKGNEYIRLEDSEVACHNCGQKLAVRLATGEYEDYDKMIPERDNWGNFFIADHPVTE